MKGKFRIKKAAGQGRGETERVERKLLKEWHTVVERLLSRDSRDTSKFVK